MNVSTQALRAAAPRRTGMRAGQVIATALLAVCVAACGTGPSWQLPDRADPSVQHQEQALGRTIQADTAREWGSGYGRWACSVRLLGSVQRTSWVWANCQSSGRVKGGFASPLTVAADGAVTPPESGDRYEPWVRAQFPEPLADLVIARDPAVMPPG